MAQRTGALVFACTTRRYSTTNLHTAASTTATVLRHMGASPLPTAQSTRTRAQLPAIMAGTTTS